MPVINVPIFNDHRDQQIAEFVGGLDRLNPKPSEMQKKYLVALALVNRMKESNANVSENDKRFLHQIFKISLGFPRIALSTLSPLNHSLDGIIKKLTDRIDPEIKATHYYQENFATKSPVMQNQMKLLGFQQEFRDQYLIQDKKDQKLLAAIRMCLEKEKEYLLFESNKGFPVSQEEKLRQQKELMRLLQGAGIDKTLLNEKNIAKTIQALWKQVSSQVKDNSNLMEMKSAVTTSHLYECARKTMQDFYQSSSAKMDFLANRLNWGDTHFMTGLAKTLEQRASTGLVEAHQQFYQLLDNVAKGSLGKEHSPVLKRFVERLTGESFPRNLKNGDLVQIAQNWVQQSSAITQSAQRNLKL